jgi:hypothetical protein
VCFHIFDNLGSKGIKFILEQAMKAQKGNRGITVLCKSALDEGFVFNATPRPLYPRERNPVPIVQVAGSAAGSVWKRA